MKKYLPGLVGLVSLFALSACGGVEIAASAATVYATKPGDLPPADTQNQIPDHSSWCYRTMGDVQCYSHAQEVPPERLINVDPANKYPMDLHAYRDSVVEGQ